MSSFLCSISSCLYSSNASSSRKSSLFIHYYFGFSSRLIFHDFMFLVGAKFILLFKLCIERIYNLIMIRYLHVPRIWLFSFLFLYDFEKVFKSGLEFNNVFSFFFVSELDYISFVELRSKLICFSCFQVSLLTGSGWFWLHHSIWKLKYDKFSFQVFEKAFGKALIRFSKQL